MPCRCDNYCAWEFTSILMLVLFARHFSEEQLWMLSGDSLWVQPCSLDMNSRWKYCEVNKQNVTFSPWYLSGCIVPAPTNNWPDLWTEWFYYFHGYWCQTRQTTITLLDYADITQNDGVLQTLHAMFPRKSNTACINQGHKNWAEESLMLKCRPTDWLAESSSSKQIPPLKSKQEQKTQRKLWLLKGLYWWR